MEETEFVGGVPEFVRDGSGWVDMQGIFGPWDEDWERGLWAGLEGDIRGEDLEDRGLAETGTNGETVWGLVMTGETGKTERDTALVAAATDSEETEDETGLLTGNKAGEGAGRKTGGETDD